MVGFYNMPVVHKELGEGRIKEWDGGTVTVRFANAEKRYRFPLVFSVKILKATNEKDETLLQEVIERRTASVIVRETAELSEGYSEEDVRAAVARIYKILNKAYKEEEIARRVAEILKKDGWETAQSDGTKIGFTGKSDFTGGAFANFGIGFLTFLASVCSLGIAYPFMVCWKLRWESARTSINGQRLKFDGNGRQLWGKYLIWLLLCVATLGVYALFFMPLNMTRWKTKHTHFAAFKDGESKFDGRIWQYFGVRFAARLVTLVTVGLGSFWAHCYLERWRAKHTSYDGYRLRFDGTGWQYFGKRIVWLLLTVVTLGIYSFWLAVKSKKWTTSHTHVIL